MRCWLIAACALAAWPVYGQQASELAQLPPVAGAELLREAPAVGDGGESLETILRGLDRLEMENTELRARLDEADAADGFDGDALPPVS